MKNILLTTCLISISTSAFALGGYETDSASTDKHQQTRKVITEAIQTSIAEQTEVLEETLTEITEILKAQTEEQVQQFQAQNAALANYFTTQDERMRQRDIDNIKFDTMQKVTTAPTTCRVLSSIKKGGGGFVPAATSSEGAIMNALGAEVVQTNSSVMSGIPLSNEPLPPSEELSKSLVLGVVAGMSAASGKPVGVSPELSTGEFEFTEDPSTPVNALASIFKDKSTDTDIFTDASFESSYNQEYDKACSAFMATSSNWVQDFSYASEAQVSAIAAVRGRKALAATAIGSMYRAELMNYCAQRTPTVSVFVDALDKDMTVSPNDKRRYEASKWIYDSKIQKDIEDMTTEVAANKEIINVLATQNDLLATIVEQNQKSNLYLSAILSAVSGE